MPGGQGPYLWRFSQASIQSDGPFSTFPSCDRWLAVWRGNPILLNELKISQLEPHHFSGDDNTFCRLTEAPVQDLGLIFNRAIVNAKMSVVEGLVLLPQSGIHYIFDVKSGDTMKFDHAAKLSVEQSLLVSVWKI